MKKMELEKLKDLHQQAVREVTNRLSDIGVVVPFYKVVIYGGGVMVPILKDKVGEVEEEFYDSYIATGKCEWNEENIFIPYKSLLEKDE